MRTALPSPFLPSMSGSCASQGSLPTGVSPRLLSLSAGDCGEKALEEALGQSF